MDHLEGLSQARKRLVKLMEEEVVFGRIEGLVVENGEPVLDPLPKIHQLIVIGKPRQSQPREDTRVEKLGELFSVFDEKQNFVLDELLVDNGLPFRMSVTKASGA